MLSFLRRIRKSLIETSSARKYLLYAIGEIVLVVIGILIALQINNWNEDRRERDSEVIILNELVENLETNIQRLESNIQRGETDNEITDIIISAIEHKIPYSDTLDQYFPRALNAIDEGSFLSYVGYESLKNAGFEIIENDELRREIVTLFEGTYKDLRARYDRIQWSSSELRKFTDQHFYRKPSRVTRVWALFDSNHLNESKNLLSWLIRLNGFRQWISELLLESQSETQRVLQLVKKELDEVE